MRRVEQLFRIVVKIVSSFVLSIHSCVYLFHR